jgi:L-threonylcarbamoyladenylate synthase
MKRYSLRLRLPVAGEILPVDIANPCEETVWKVSSALLEGGIVVYPSDTVYGILADANNKEVYREVALAKGYTESKPFIILAGSIAAALEMTSGIDAEEIMKKYWPGPVTLVFPASGTVNEWQVGGTGTIALRVPADPLTTAVLARSGLKLVSTSANQRGGPSPLSLDDIPETLKSLSSITLDGGRLAGREPSRILDYTGSKPLILR